MTKSTLWGIVNHSSLKYSKCYHRYESKEKSENICSYKNERTACKVNDELEFYHIRDNINEREDWSIEACIVAVADEIAQRHHDIEDGLYAGIIDKDDLYNIIRTVFKGLLSRKYKEYLNTFKLERMKILNFIIYQG